jgi:hypothetical protein
MSVRRPNFVQVTTEGDKETGEPELFEQIVELGSKLHDQELSSADSLGTRAVTLIGFSSVVLTLTAALARDAFGQGRDLGDVGNAASAIIFLLAVGCLLVSAIQAVRAAAPRSQNRVSTQVFDTYRQEKPRVRTLHEHFGEKQQDVIEDVAASNTARGKTLQWAFRWLVAGLLLVAGQAAIMGIDRLTEVF